MFCWFFFFIRCQRSDLRTERMCWKWIVFFYRQKEKIVSILILKPPSAGQFRNLLLAVSLLNTVLSLVYFHFEYYRCYGDDFFLSRCILGCFSRYHGINDIVKETVHIFFILSEIKYSATSNRDGTLHGWLFITYFCRLWCHVALFKTDVEYFVFMLIKIQLIFKKLSPKTAVGWTSFFSVKEQKKVLITVQIYLTRLWIFFSSSPK